MLRRERARQAPREGDDLHAGETAPTGTTFNMIGSDHLSRGEKHRPRRDRRRNGRARRLAALYSGRATPPPAHPVDALRAESSTALSSFAADVRRATRRLAGISRRRRLVALAVLLSLGLPSAGWEARAQTSNVGFSAGPSIDVATPLQPDLPFFTTPPLPRTDGMIGVWPDFRRRLQDEGIAFLLDARVEFAGNVSGGTRQTAASANQIGFENDIDWNKLADIGGLMTHLIITNREGGNTGRGYGDTFLRPQDLNTTNGGNVVAHLTALWAQETLAHGRLDLLAGRYPVGFDFASSPLYCSFMSKGFCGNPRALSNSASGFTTYPNPTWGSRVRIRPTTSIYLQFGLFSYENGLGNLNFYRSGWKFDSSDIVGEEFPIELGYEPVIGRGQLPGHYKVGFAYNNAPHSDLYYDVNGSAIARTGKQARVDHGETQWWVTADQMLLHHRPTPNSGLTLLCGVAGNDATTATYGTSAYAALVDRGFLSARPRDGAGLAFTYADFSPLLTRTQEVQAARHRSLANGATGIQTREKLVEVFYDIRIAQGLNFQPDAMYVIHPNAQTNIPNAFVLGFKIHAAL